MGDGAQHWFRGAFQNIGERDVQIALAQPDGGVERGEATEAHMQRRHGSAWTDRAIHILKYQLQLGTHDNASLALPPVSVECRKHSRHSTTYQVLCLIQRKPIEVA